MTEKNEHAAALGRLGKGKRKTITPAATAARKANMALARAAQRARPEKKTAVQSGEGTIQK